MKDIIALYIQRYGVTETIGEVFRGLNHSTVMYSKMTDDEKRFISYAAVEVGRAWQQCKKIEYEYQHNGGEMPTGSYDQRSLRLFARIKRIFT